MPHMYSLHGPVHLIVSDSILIGPCQASCPVGLRPSEAQASTTRGRAAQRQPPQAQRVHRLREPRFCRLLGCLAYGLAALDIPMVSAQGRAPRRPRLRPAPSPPFWVLAT